MHEDLNPKHVARRRPKGIKKIFFILIYLSMIFLLTEFLIRICFHIDPLFNRLKCDNDSAWRISWVKRHDKSRQIYYTSDLYDATKGWITRPHLRNHPAFKNKSVVNTNSRGLRGKREFSYEKTPGLTRILILGDSFSFGDEVNDDQTYSYYLQEMLPETEVINMGIHGYGHDQMLILLREEGIKYRPDIVILGFIYEDMNRNLLAFRDFAKPKFILKNNQLVLVNSPIPSPEKILSQEWHRLKILDLFSMIVHAVEDKAGILKKQKENITRHILQDIANISIEIDAVPIFVYMPVGLEIVNDEYGNSAQTCFSTICKNIHLAECTSVRCFSFCLNGL